jgi:hypothetical protein
MDQVDPNSWNPIKSGQKQERHSSDGVIAIQVPNLAKESATNMKSALLNFMAQIILNKSARNVTKFFMIPVGLPGMGKSTLAHYIREATESILS